MSLAWKENYIRYVVCLEDGDARLEIYRVGYAPEDTAEKPFAVTKRVNWKEKTQEILTPENADAFHKLTVEVDGNGHTPMSTASSWMPLKSMDFLERKYQAAS